MSGRFCLLLLINWLRRIHYSLGYLWHLLFWLDLIRFYNRTLLAFRLVFHNFSCWFCALFQIFLLEQLDPTFLILLSLPTFGCLLCCISNCRSLYLRLILSCPRSTLYLTRLMLLSSRLIYIARTNLLLTGLTLFLWILIIKGIFDNNCSFASFHF